MRRAIGIPKTPAGSGLGLFSISAEFPFNPSKLEVLASSYNGVINVLLPITKKNEACCVYFKNTGTSRFSAPYAYCVLQILLAFLTN